MAKDAAPVTERLVEYASSAGVKLTVDRERGVIPGVKILGLVSANGRTYTPECAANAKPMYEGAKVNVNHPKKNATGPRDYGERMGSIRNVQIKEDGLYGDFHFNPKHALAEQLIWDAEHAPESVGFSHDCEARTSRRDGKTVVECITRVRAVDLVADPATTRGLFESADDLPSEPAQRELAEHGLSALTDARQIILGTDSIEAKKSRLVEVLDVFRTELTGKPSITETSTMEWKDITRESLTENRKDLVEVLMGTDATSKLTAEVKSLKESLDAKNVELKVANDKVADTEAEKAKLAQTAAIAEEIKAAFGEKASDEVIVSPLFKEKLTEAKDADARKRLIEDRQKLLKGHAPTTGGAPFAPLTGGTKTHPTVNDTLAAL
jgi:hypothetical protein